eukprot:1457351-Prymnesium_polylepis.1
MFFTFGATPLPSAAALGCADCTFYAQDGRTDTGLPTAPGVHGAFAWVEPTAAGGWGDNLNSFYASQCGGGAPCVGAAFAGFRAVYPQDGWIPRSLGTLRYTLELCAEHTAVCQVGANARAAESARKRERGKERPCLGSRARLVRERGRDRSCLGTRARGSARARAARRWPHGTTITRGRMCSLRSGARTDTRRSSMWTSSVA